MLPGFPVARVLAAGLVGALCAAAAHAGEHPEIGVGRTAAGRLVAHMHFSQPVPIPRSIFPGFSGYATGLIGFENVTLDEPAEDLFTLALGSNISARLTARDSGAAVYNGLSVLQVGESLEFGPPFFDFHPIFSVPNLGAIPGSSNALRFVLHDSAGVYADSEEFTIVMTPACPGDFDLSGEVRVTDIFAFLSAWFSGDSMADFDRQNGLQVQDVFGFINAWFVPCP